MRFREDILARELIGCLREEQRRLLARISVFEVAVPMGILAVLGAEQEVMGRLVDLSLVEVSEGEIYRVNRVLMPLLAEVLSEEEWLESWQIGVRRIYQVWWEETDDPTEERALEIVRLGLLAREREITIVVGDAVATLWVNRSRFMEALDLCNEILNVFEDDYRILGTIARAEEVVGFASEALDHYQRALDLCPEGDQYKKAATLNNMAGVIARQGDIQRALQLWQQSLELSESINHIQHTATTLGYMGQVAWQSGDPDQAIDLLTRSAQALAQCRAYLDLITALGNLGVIKAEHGQPEFAQAIWISLRTQPPLQYAIAIIQQLFNQVPQADSLESLLAAYALILCSTRGQDHPQIAQLQQQALQMISAAARSQGIETQEAFDAWFVDQQLNDPQGVIDRLTQALEGLIGDRWLFDRGLLEG